MKLLLKKNIVIEIMVVGEKPDGSIELIIEVHPPPKGGVSTVSRPWILPPPLLPRQLGGA